MEAHYTKLCQEESDINEHLPTLREYASKCTKVCELGVRGVVSTVAIACGMSSGDLYLYDITPDISLERIEEGCFSKGINIIDHFGQDDLAVEDYGDTYEMLFIDTAHNYPQCYEELCKFGSKTSKYILLHDTEIDGITSECVRLGYEKKHYQMLVNQFNGKYTEEEFKVGLGSAIRKWLNENPEWGIIKEYQNNNGLTILAHR